MKTSTAAVIGITVLLFAIMVSRGGSAQDNEATRTEIQAWEYTTINYREKWRDGKRLEGEVDSDKMMKLLGEEGWELVAIDPTYWDTSRLSGKRDDPYRVIVASGATHYFKRPKRLK